MSGPRAATAAPAASRAPAAVAAGLLLVLGVLIALVVPFDPLPGSVLAPDPARDFTAAEIARSEAFTRTLRPSSYGALVLGLAVSAVLALTPLGARLVRRTGRRWPLQVVLGVLALAVVGRLATLPLSARSEQVLRDFGLSTRTWGSWAQDVVLAVAVDVVITAVVALVVVALARRLPRSWWAWSAGAVAALAMAGSFAYPLLVEPVFNSFTPLPAGELRDDLLALAERDGVPVDDVLVSDASRRTTSLNAYVSGFGQTRRIVLYDTLVEQATPEEVLLVVAHELGHVEDRDVLTGTALGALGGAAGVCALAALLSWRPLLRRSGAGGPGDPAVLPLVLGLVAFGTLATAPVYNLVSQRIEARADVHSLDLTRDPETFRASQQRLARDNVADLSPPLLVELFLRTHPSTPDRLAAAREWERLRG